MTLLRRCSRLGAALAALALLTSACSYTVTLDPIAPAAESSRILAADGTLIVRLDGAEDRESVALDDMAAAARDAVIAIEDHRFFEHDGVDYRAVARALRRNAEAGEIEEGGSTITQQYVRVVLTGRERTVSRKLRETALAIELERRLDKDEILERYLNTVYFGNGAYGVEAAARRYFDTSAGALTLPQAALLAAQLRSPEQYDPWEHPDAARARRDLVLDKMVEYGFVAEAEAVTAKTNPIELADADAQGTYLAPHFVERVKRFVLDDPRFGDTPEERRRLLFQGGLRIETTLQPRAQAAAELAIASVLSDPAHDPDAALVAIEPTTGHVLAYVGGGNFFTDDDAAKFDLASQARRQAGSSFKPFVLAAAIEHDVPLTQTYEAPGDIEIPVAGQPVWKVHNYDGDGSGRMDLVEATVSSVNTVYAQLIMDIGAQRVVDVASQMGIESELAPYPSTALGTNAVSALDMASAYSTLAADGMHALPVFVTRVTDHDGTVLYQASATPSRVLPAETARQVNAILEQVVTRGTGINARIGRPVAGKTGTGEEWRDAWFVGSTPELTAAVWVGFHDAERSMVPPTTRVQVTGGLWPAQIWATFAGAHLAETPVSQFPAPGEPEVAEAVKTRTVPDVRGMPGDRATEILAHAGFTVVTAEAPNRDYPPGRVLRQTPAGRTTANLGSDIELVLSRLPKVLRVPNVLGRAPDEALALGRYGGFQVRLIREAEPPPGSAGPSHTWKQSPAAGTRIDEGATLTVWVNPAPPPTTTTTVSPPPTTTTTPPTTIPSDAVIAETPTTLAPG